MMKMRKKMDAKKTSCTMKRMMDEDEMRKMMKRMQKRMHKMKTENHLLAWRHTPARE